MLIHLSITNYAIIEQIDLDFENGFTVITGETGAGKSILLGAIALILGKRSDTSVLNNKDKKCVVEATFNIKKDKYANFFAINDLDFEKETIVRREISKTGKSRAFVNDTPVNLKVLKELSSQFIDVHSQHQTLNLQSNQYQLNVLDSYAQLTTEIESYRLTYTNYKKNKRKLDQLISQTATEKADIDYLKFQINEIEELNLQPNEKEEIQNQLAVINNSELIKSTLEKASYLLNDSDKNIASLLKDVVNTFSQVTDYDDTYKVLYERLNSLSIELDDVTSEVKDINNTFNFDISEAQNLTSRLSNIYGLEQKHQVVGSDELLSLFTHFKEKLSSIKSVGTEIEDLKIQLSQEEFNLFKVAKKISKKRLGAIPELEKTITNNLADLGMPEASFIVKQHELDELNENGSDDIIFLFSANKGFEVKELDKAASGGELSRLMLTIKAVLANNSAVSSIIFDEIDTGVSGDVADKMASLMRGMADNIQVIAITHLPQVAAKGTTHISIYKESDAAKTSTYLKVLSEEERVSEIAKMLSGKKTSVIAKENAKILLES